MKFKLIIFLFLLVGQITIAQHNNIHEYYGFVKLNDSALISYSLEFKLEDNIVKGFSITDLGGPHETKSNISGYYDKNEKHLTFKEYGIIYTKSSFIKEDFCFVNFEGKRVKLGNNTKFSGKFKGLFSNLTECINGEVYLSSRDKVDKRIAKTTKKINRMSSITDSVKAKINPIKLMDTIQMNVLRKDKVLSVFSKTKNVKFVLYDGGQEDGDSISVSLNNKTILDNYETKIDKKSIPIILNQEKTSIILKAESTGTISTNTTVLEIYVDNNKIKALTNLKKGEQTQIDLYLIKK